MKSLITSIAILGILSLGVGVAVQGEPSADVSATVTAQLITISVANGDVDYGILPINTTKDTTATGVNNTQIVTNNGNIAVDLEVKSSDAVGGNQWNLAATAGADEFTHKFCVAADCDGAPTWTAFNSDNNIYVSMATNIATPIGTQDFDLEIGTPSSVTDNMEKTITVTVLATATP